MKFLEEGIKDHGQEDSPYDGREKRGEYLIKEINGEESEEEDEDEKDMFPFHFLSPITLTILKSSGENRPHVKTSVLLNGREGWVFQPGLGLYAQCFPRPTGRFQNDHGCTSRSNPHHFLWQSQ